MRGAMFHVMGDLLPGIVFLAIILLMLSMPDLVVEAIRIVVR